MWLLDSIKQTFEKPKGVPFWSSMACPEIKYYSKNDKGLSVEDITLNDFKNESAFAVIIDWREWKLVLKEETWIPKPIEKTVYNWAWMTYDKERLKYEKDRAKKDKWKKLIYLYDWVLKEFKTVPANIPFGDVKTIIKKVLYKNKFKSKKPDENETIRAELDNINSDFLFN